MSDPEEQPTPSPARRGLWLVGVPVLAALIPWLVLSGADANPRGLALLAIGSLPLLGGLGALSFSFVAPVRVWPLVPYLLATAVFLFVLLAASDITHDDGLQFGPASVLAVALPLLALLGGLASFAWVPEVVVEPEYESRS